MMRLFGYYIFAANFDAVVHENLKLQLQIFTLIYIYAAKQILFNSALVV